MTHYASVAQLEEQIRPKDKVVGSSPARGTNSICIIAVPCRLCYYKTMVKKQQNPKKSSAKKVTRKTPVKRALKGAIQARKVTIGIIATMLAFAAAAVLAYLALGAIERAEVSERKDRIMAVYESLAIDQDGYIVQEVDVFGDKRPYDWDAGRTHSSSVVYSHGDTVSGTITELDAAVKAAGFTFIEEPYPDTPGVIQYHYKSEKGEYLRLTVESKPRAEAFQNANLMGELDRERIEQIRNDIDPNTGPVKVTIKVNLDDNNE